MRRLAIALLSASTFVALAQVSAAPELSAHDIMEKNFYASKI